MAKKFRGQREPLYGVLVGRNMVHKEMVEQHKSVAMKSEKDYDRRKLKRELKHGLEDC